MRKSDDILVATSASKITRLRRSNYHVYFHLLACSILLKDLDKPENILYCKIKRGVSLLKFQRALKILPYYLPGKLKWTPKWTNSHLVKVSDFRYADDGSDQPRAPRDRETRRTNFSSIKSGEEKRKKRNHHKKITFVSAISQSFFINDGGYKFPHSSSSDTYTDI